MGGELTVTEFNRRVKEVISHNGTLCNVKVIGEIYEHNSKYSNRIYITLKDDDNSTLECVLFKDPISKVTFSIEDGKKVIVSGSADYYDKRGIFKFKIKSIILFEEKGEQQIALEKLTAQLMNEGLFDTERKKKIPKYPKTIGVVTSSEGAAIGDIISKVSERFPVNILLSPATVQGEKAPQSIVDAIKLLERQNVDVIIIGRGGGSVEDLSAFNNESVLRAVSNCKIPTISAIGHAENKTLCDRIADECAKTPTDAAVIATPNKKEEEQRLKDLWEKINEYLLHVVEKMKSRFDLLDQKLSPDKIRIIVSSYIDKHRHTCECIDSNIDTKMKSARDKLDSFTEKLNSLNPSMVLSRGYSFIINDQGNVVTSINNLFIGSKINIKMKDGTAIAEIKGRKLDE